MTRPDEVKSETAASDSHLVSFQVRLNVTVKSQLSNRICDRLVRLWRRSAVFAHLREERLVDLHPRVGALRQRLPAPPPGVVHRWVGVGDTAKKHCPLKVELLLCLADALVDRYHRIVQV